MDIITNVFEQQTVARLAVLFVSNFNSAVAFASSEGYDAASLLPRMTFLGRQPLHMMMYSSPLVFPFPIHTYGFRGAGGACDDDELNTNPPTPSSSKHPPRPKPKGSGQPTHGRTVEGAARRFRSQQTHRITKPKQSKNISKPATSLWVARYTQDVPMCRDFFSMSWRRVVSLCLSVCPRYITEHDGERAQVGACDCYMKETRSQLHCWQIIYVARESPMVGASHKSLLSRRGYAARHSEAEQVSSLQALLLLLVVIRLERPGA